MVYAHKVQRVTISGTMFSGTEQWSTGFWMGKESADAGVFTEVTAQNILAAWETFFENSLHAISTQYATTQVKTALLLDTGQTDTTQVHYAYPGSAINGAVASNTHPPQNAVVVTLLSDRPRGLASKGRMYLPGFSGSIDATAKMTSATRDNIATGMKTFFDSFVGDVDFNGNELILVAKGTGALPALTAQNDYVESLRVGDVVDTQRRRRNSLNEVFTTRVLA